MSLTGTPFLALLVALTVAAFVAVIVVWPALAGRSWRRVTGRGGLLLMVNALTVLTCFTALNAHYQFYADWTDLSGAVSDGPTTVALTADHAAPAVLPTRATPSSTPWSTPRSTPRSSQASPVVVPRTGTGATVLSFRVNGPLSGLTGQVLVRLPPGYGEPGSSTTTYPVLETFSGYPSNPQQWLGTMHLGSVIDQLALSGELREPLVVSPQLELPAGVDTECVDGAPGRPALETWLTEDVPQWVASTFRVRSDRQSWATLGLSTGGWCASMAAMLHPAQFGAAISLGGYFRPEFGRYKPYRPHTPLAERYDLVHLALRSPPPVALWVETSRADRVSYGSTAALLRVARQPMSVDAVVLDHAGHRTGVWAHWLVPSLRWLGVTLPGFGRSA